VDVLRNLDLLLLLLALPVFVLIDAPIAGYLAAGGAWIIGRIGMEMAARRRVSALRRATATPRWGSPPRPRWAGSG